MARDTKLGNEDGVVSFRFANDPFKVEPYPVEMVFMAGDKEWTKFRAALGDPSPGVHAAITKCPAVHEGINYNLLVFFMSDSALDQSDVEFGCTIAHETAHAATAVCDACNFDPGVGRESEPFAYLTESIFRQAWVFFSKRRKRK